MGLGDFLDEVFADDFLGLGALAVFLAGLGLFFVDFGDLRIGVLARAWATLTFRPISSSEVPG